MLSWTLWVCRYNPPIVLKMLSHCHLALPASHPSSATIPKSSWSSVTQISYLGLAEHFIVTFSLHFDELWLYMCDAFSNNRILTIQVGRVTKSNDTILKHSRVSGTSLSNNSNRDRSFFFLKIKIKIDSSIIQYIPNHSFPPLHSFQLPVTFSLPQIHSSPVLSSEKSRHPKDDSQIGQNKIQ